MANLSTEEARALIEEMKKYVEQAELEFPTSKNRYLSFEVIGEKRENEFIINIYKRRINPHGCTWQGRIKRDNTVLLRLDVSPTTKHGNPDTDKVISGTHLHIYTEEYGDRCAVPFDIKNMDLYQTTMAFFEQFHVIEPPKILYKPELDSHVRDQ